MLGFFYSRRNWDSPIPLPPGESDPLPFGSGGGGHTRLRERGWWSPNSDEGTYIVVLYLYMYFVIISFKIETVVGPSEFSIVGI